VVGHLFKSTGRETSKTELLVFLTPKIVADSAPTR
jgi:type IV pilus assembly protein PilQ